MLHEALPPDCLRFRETLHKQLDETSLSVEEARLLDTHPKNCPTCEAYAQQMDHILETLQTLAPLPVPEDLSDRVFAKIKQPLPFRRPVYLAIAASVLAAVVSTSVLSSWQPSKPTDSPPALLTRQLAQKPQNAEKPSAVEPALKAPVKEKQQTVSPPASRKILIAMAPPEESFFGSDPTETEENDPSDLLAHWVPLEEEAERVPETQTELLEDPLTDQEETTDPMSTLVGF